MTIIKLTTVGGKPVEYVDEIIGQGGMKDVYFSPDKSYAVAFSGIRWIIRARSG